MWVGFCNVECGDPSPKSQSHVVFAGLLMLLFVNEILAVGTEHCTVDEGAKLAVGSLIENPLFVKFTVDGQPLYQACRVTDFAPGVLYVWEIVLVVTPDTFC